MRAWSDFVSRDHGAKGIKNPGDIADSTTCVRHHNFVDHSVIHVRPRRRSPNSISLLATVCADSVVSK